MATPTEAASLAQIHEDLCLIAKLLAPPCNVFTQRYTLIQGVNRILDPFPQDTTMLFTLKNKGTQALTIWWQETQSQPTTNYETLEVNEFRAYATAPPVIYVQPSVSDTAPVLELSIWS